MNDDLRHALTAAVLRLLRPLVRLLLRYGMSYAEFATLAKRAYTDVAATEFKIRGRKQSVSRISIITGLSRKEVRRLLDLQEPSAENSTVRYNRAVRVISGWVRDSRFADTTGQPRSLYITDDDKTDFQELVKCYSGDVPPRAMLDELLRVGAVTLADDGRVVLRSRAYIPKSSEMDKLEILGNDVAQLIATIDHNLTCPAADVFFQRKVAYHRLPIHALASLHMMVARGSQAHLEALDCWMSEQERLAFEQGSQEIKTKRAGLGIYYFEETTEDRS